MKKPPGKCIFCERGGLSKEHVWSEWTYELVPRLPKGAHVRRVSHSTPHSHFKKVESAKRYEGSVNTVKLRVVCKHCNTGWMSRLDEKAKCILPPFILGTHGVINKSASDTIAAWIAMKLMVTEFARPLEVATPLHDRRYLMDTGKPPDNWQIWVAPVISKKWRAGYVRSSSLLDGVDGAGRPIIHDNGMAKNAQAMTLGVGRLLFLAVSTTIPQLRFENPLEARRYIRPIWPFTESFLWPPGPALDTDGATILSRGLDTLVSSLPWGKNAT